MRIAIIGQRDFGKAVLDAFINRGDTGYDVGKKLPAPQFCAAAGLSIGAVLGV